MKQLVRFDHIVTFKQSSIVGQIVSSPVFLSQLVLLDLVNKSFVRQTTWIGNGRKIQSNNNIVIQNEFFSDC